MKKIFYSITLISVLLSQASQSFILKDVKVEGNVVSSANTIIFTSGLRKGLNITTAEFPREIYSIDRKSTENREVVEFELAAPTDLAGVRIPKRQCTRTEFPGIGTFSQ